MQDFSDVGYEYLGELMASKGYIFRLPGLSPKLRTSSKVPAPSGDSNVIQGACAGALANSDSSGCAQPTRPTQESIATHAAMPTPLAFNLLLIIRFIPLGPPTAVRSQAFTAAAMQNVLMSRSCFVAGQQEFAKNPYHASYVLSRCICEVPW